MSVIIDFCLSRLCDGYRELLLVTPILPSSRLFPPYKSWIGDDPNQRHVVERAEIDEHRNDVQRHVGQGGTVFNHRQSLRRIDERPTVGRSERESVNSED